MKKICFYLFIFSALCLFFLFSCSKADSLYDILIYATSSVENLPAGSILCYGKIHENSVSDGTLFEYLGINGYPEFKDKIEELVFYSSIGKKHVELALIKLYSADDVSDARLCFERRISDARRAFAFMDMPDTAKDAYIRTYSNTVVLYMTEDNHTLEKLIEKAIR